MKFRSFVLVLAAIAAVLLTVGIGGGVWLAAQSPLGLLRGGEVASPEAAMFVPKQAPLMVSLLVNPERLERLRLAIATPGKRRQARNELAQLEQTLLGDRGLSYAEDVQPWLGDEVTWAVTTPDLDRDLANGLQPGYLLAVATRDPQQAREFLQVFWQKRAIAGTELVFEQYAGVRIIAGSPAGKGTGVRSQEPGAKGSGVEQSGEVLGLASAVVGDRFVLFANAPKVLRDAINNVQAVGLGLGNSRAYQSALKQLPARQVGLAFVNLPQLGQWLGQTEDAKTAEQRQFESLVAGFVLERQGVTAETALLPIPGKSLPVHRPALSEPVEALQYIPAGAPIAAAGTNLQALWTQLSEGLAGYGVLSALVNQPIADLEQLWGVQFSEELVGWVQRQFALALVPNPNTQKPDWVFAAEKTAGTAATIEKLDAIAQKQGLSIGPVALGDQPAFAWTKLSTRGINKRKKQPVTTLQANVQGVHTSLGQYELFATSVEALDQSLKAPSSPLVKSDLYERAIAPLDKTNDGYLYLDWNAVKGVLEDRIPLLKLVELTAKPFFDRVRSLTITSYGSETNLRRGAVFVRLQS